MQSLQHGDSGENGVPSLAYPLVLASISALPREPQVKQHIKLTALATEYLFINQEQLPNVESATAEQFDVFIAPIYGNIKNVARDVWPLALRWRAINEAMNADRRQKNLPYVRRDQIAARQFILRVILPQVLDETSSQAE